MAARNCGHPPAGASTSGLRAPASDVRGSRRECPSVPSSYLPDVDPPATRACSRYRAPFLAPSFAPPLVPAPGPSFVDAARTGGGVSTPLRNDEGWRRRRRRRGVRNPTRESSHACASPARIVRDGRRSNDRSTRCFMTTKRNEMEENSTSLFDDGNDDATRARGDAGEAGRRGVYCDSGTRDNDDDARRPRRA